MADGKETPKKPEEILKDVLEIIDIPTEQKEKLNSGLYETDAVKDSFHETYIAKKLAAGDEDIRSKIHGEVFRIITQRLQKGFDLSNEDVKEKKWEDIFDTGMTKHGDAVKALQEQVKTPEEGAEQIKKLEESIKIANEKTATAVEEQQKSNQQLEEKQKEFDGQIKQSKVTMLINNELSKLTFRDDISPLEKSGFNSLISEGYKFDLDDKNNLKVTDKDGNGVQNEKKTEMLTAGEVLTMEAATNKLLKLNSGAAAPPTKTGSPGVTFDAFGGQKPTNGAATPPEKGKPVLHPTAIKNTEQIETASQSS